MKIFDFHNLYIKDGVLNFTYKMKILVIKLGALGDVLRTTPILEAIKEKYPDSEITWITEPESKEILEGNPNISKILTLPIEEISEGFDVLYGLDIENEAIQLASKINAKKKYGYFDKDNERVLMVPDSHGENHLLKNTWKENDESMWFEVIGNIYENPELIK